MAKASTALSLGLISLDRASSVSLYRQLYESLREAILKRQLKPGTQLPATRVLAVDLDVSRNTVTNAYDQLTAEGYLTGKTGAGTFVTLDLPDEVLQVRSSRQPAQQQIDHSALDTSDLSRRGAAMMATPVTLTQYSLKPRPFRTGLPDLDAFPTKIWARLMARRWRALSPDLLTYGPPAGYQPLREAIAAYVGAARGVRCEPDQVMVVSGAQQALDLAARVLLNPGDPVWVEDPGYLGARAVLLAAGAQLIPVPVDDQGLDVEAGWRACPKARLACITPSHQYPLGVTMSLSRRLNLLEWATQSGAYVLEDDYDSEYRYTGHPLSALQSLDTTGRVIYIGTFSKVLFPGLRLGYMIAPPHLVDLFVAARELADRGSAWFEQAVLADFIVDGHFARHIRRMRTLYAERQAALVRLAQERLSGQLEIKSAEAGLHLVGWLPEHVDDRLISQRLAGRGVEARPVSAYALTPPRRGGLVLGYAAISVESIHRGVDQLEKTLQEGLG